MKAVKFNFDDDFEVRPEDIEKTRAADTLQQVEAARSQSYTDGVEEGRRQAFAEIESHTAQSMESVSHALKALQQDGQQLREINEGKSAALSYLIARKIAGKLVDENPEGVIETVIQEALRAGHRENTLTVHVSSALAENMKPCVEGLKAQSTFGGEIKVVASPALEGVDCRIEWTDGGLEYNQDDVIKQIDAIISNFMTAKSENANQSVVEVPEPSAQTESPVQTEQSEQTQQSAATHTVDGTEADQV